MAERRFKVGMEGDVEGVRWRITEGRKWDGDQVLEFYAGGRWVKVKMSVGFLMADFIYENETHRPNSPRGGQMYLDYCQTAAVEGWRTVHERLEAERERYRVRQGSHVAEVQDPDALLDGRQTVLEACFVCLRALERTYEVQLGYHEGCAEEAQAMLKGAA